MTNSIKDLDASVIEEFAAQLRGRLVNPQDSDYNETRKVYNGMIDKHPGLFAMCEDVADVMAAVNFGRENNVLVAVRGGGHNGGGLGLCDEGLVIDLSGIKFVRVDTSNHTVRVGGGNLWGEVDHATHPFGLAVPAGIISTTGVGGLTLGGGVGHLSRKYGLTIDNLLEADMVLADGSFVTVNSTEHSDLFWAIRGGGGNFGIVTSFKFQAHPVKNVFGGPTLWPIEQTEEIMKWYHDFINNAPDELNGFIATMVIPGAPFPEELHNKQFCGIVWCYAGDMNMAEEAFKPILAKNPLFAHVGEMPYPAIQTLFDGLLPHGLQWYWRADFFKELGPEVRAKHLEFGSTIPTPLSQMHLYPISGAAARVGADETPWAYRDAKYAGVIVGVDPDPENAEKITNWCKDYWEALHPYSSGGAYSNFMMEEGQERVQASYKHNYDRLASIKQKYDGNNFFRVNQNIKPKS
ncbi:MAG: FAD-binding oxidoreductase [Bacteroidia bacterium]|nr:FAD-binding oxidoreductase [Bacteroidia bacterium]NNF29962.1 FAD-binding oxidoreductase [Flavobacteriaceae bacterium]MBT8276058.1 FAD-binding oxidoreductase [Bacteroidia bacterium]NNJ81214.1 FAD-binding oxidoreductase [Flavobacteriaceae bacterium]NNK53667.1 FAD-binding oxidoreductase [Flavobacteriaceae bacterium]